MVDSAEEGSTSVVQEHRVVVAYSHPLEFALVSPICLVAVVSYEKIRQGHGTQ